MGRVRSGREDLNHPGRVNEDAAPYLVPLSEQVLAVLEEIRPLTGRGRYVLPSTPSRYRPMSENAVTAALRGIGYETDSVTGHGFRVTTRTILDEGLGFRPDIIEHQLAHEVRDSNGRSYNRTSHLPERMKMMQERADYLDKLRTQPAKSA